MKAIVYRLRLLEPLLVARAGAGEENSAVTLPHISGSAIRGTLAARWLRSHPGVNLATDADARAWFMDGTVCYLNAYPEDDGERTLPRPASWFVREDEPDEPPNPIHDLAVGEDPGLGALKQPGAPFCRVERVLPPEDEPYLPVRHQVRLVRPLRSDQMHIALEDANTRGEGNQIFRYESLASGQIFAGAIVAPESADLGPLASLLRLDDLMLGRAHLSGYGRTAIESCAMVEKGWQEYPSNGATGDRVVVTLLSDAIVRGANGQAGWDGGLALAAALGCPDGTRPTGAFGRTVVVGGYNRRWSLPLPQDWALAAGSVFVFDAGQIAPAALATAVERGVGERKPEGYGRLAAGWQAASLVERPFESEANVSVPVLSAESEAVARAMVQRRLRLLLDRALDQRVNANVEALSGRLPENAQLSAIRQAVAPGLAGKGLQSLATHLGNLKKTGRSQLERCRLGNQTLFDWLRERAEKCDIEAQILQQSHMALPVMAGQTAALNDSLRAEYTARLIDGIMRQAARVKEAAR